MKNIIIFISMLDAYGMVFYFLIKSVFSIHLALQYHSDKRYKAT